MFDHLFQSDATKKKLGKREVNVNKLDMSSQQQFLGTDGGREREWRAWQDFGAVEVFFKVRANAPRKPNRANALG